MRYTTVEGIDDGFKINLGSSVSIICAVMEMRRELNLGDSELEMTGSELLAFIGKFKVGGIEDISDEVDKKIRENVKEENRYVVTAYDW